MNNCFVIMPFSTSKTHSDLEWDAIFEDFFKVAWENCGFTCCRSDISRGSITKNIIERLYFDSIVFADLTDSNPNVLYELGVRHTLKKPSIMVKQKKSEIPFDVNDYNVFEYENTPTGLKKLIKHIEKAVKDIKKYPNKPDNPVWDFLYAENIVKEYEKSFEIVNKLKSLKNEFESNKTISKEFIGKIKDIKIPKDNIELQDFEWDFDEKTFLIRASECYFPLIQGDSLKHLIIYRYVNFSKEALTTFEEINKIYNWCNFYTSNIGTYELDGVEKNRIIKLIDLIEKGLDITKKRISELETK